MNKPNLFCDFVPSALTAADKVTLEEVRQKRAGMGLLDRLRHSDLWEAVGQYCPPALRRVGVTFLEKKIPRREADMDAVIAHLRPMQQAQTHALEAQLGRQFNEWKTLWNTPS